MADSTAAIASDMPWTLQLRSHGAMPKWAKIFAFDGGVFLAEYPRIKAVPEWEGAGFAIDRRQAEQIVKAVNMHERLVAALEVTAELWEPSSATAQYARALLAEAEKDK